MASSNAALALRLQQSPTYTKLPKTYRIPWLEACLKLPLQDIDFPLTPQDFEGYSRDDRVELGELVTQRLRNYGLVTGSSYVRDKSHVNHKTGAATIEIKCIFHGVKTANKHNLAAFNAPEL